MALAGLGGDRRATDHLHDAEVLVDVDGRHGLVREERLFRPLDRALDGASQPAVPAGGWGGNGWTFWQHSSTGTVPGISGAVDLDRFNGSSLPASLFVP